MKAENTDNQTGGGDIFLVGMPLETYQKLQDAALKQGITLAEAMSRAFNGYLGGVATESAASARKLLLESRG